MKISLNKVFHSHVKIQLSGIFKVAIDENLTDNNPCRGVKPLRLNNIKEKYLNVDDEEKLLKACEKDKYFKYLRPILITLLQTGMRKNEVLKMQWSSVDFKNEVFTLYDTKNNKVRKVPMSQTLVKIFKDLKQNSNSAYCFVNAKMGKPYYDIQNAMKKLCKSAGVPYINIHG